MIEEQDPRLTSFVLGELDERQAAEVAAAVANSPELQRVVAEIRTATARLDEMFRAESPLQLHPDQRDLLARAAAGELPAQPAEPVTVAGRHPLWGNDWSPSLMVAAALTMLMLGIGYLLSQPGELRRVSQAPEAERTWSDDESVDRLGEDLEMGAFKGGRGRDDSGMPSGEANAPALANAAGSAQLAGAEPDTEFDLAPAEQPAEAMHRFQAKGAGGGGFGGGGISVPDGGTGLAGGISVPATSEADTAPDFALAQQNVPTADSLVPEALSPGSRGADSRMQNQAGLEAPPTASLLALGGQTDSSKNALLGIEVETAVADKVAELKKQTEALMDREGLNGLPLEVQVQRMSVVRDIELPQAAWVQEQKPFMVSPGDGTVTQKNVPWIRPQTSNVLQQVQVEVVSPELAVTDLAAARRIVDEWAQRVDPDSNRVLDLEELLGVAGVLQPDPSVDLTQDQDRIDRALRRSENDNRQLAQNQAIPLAGGGKMSVTQKQVSPGNVATDNLAVFLNRHVTRNSLELYYLQTDVAGENGPAGQAAGGGDPGQAAPVSPAARTRETDSAGQAAGAPAQQGARPEGFQARTALDNQAVVTMAPRSLDEVDITPLLKALMTQLEQRNREVLQRNQAVPAEPGQQ